MKGQEQRCPQQDHCLLNGEKHILLEKYEMGTFLGQGTFAKVYKAKSLVTQESVAIKVIHKDHIQEEGLIDQIKREISVMHLVKHPNIVELKEVMATKSKIYFVMEYVKGGDLFSKIIKGKLKEDLARKYFQQLINAVDYCHSRGVSHRDLKLENLLLDEEGNLKVSDFGLSALPEQHWNDGLLHTQCGTPAYIAPEVLRKKGYDGAEADIWSCGVILFVLLAGHLPFQDENITKMFIKICKAEYVFPPWISPEAKKLISKLLIVDPDKRITFPQIMRNSWFRKGLSARTCPSHSFDSEDNNNLDSCSRSTNHQHHSPPFCNAFELISSMSAGCNLSTLFEEQKKRGSVFTSKCPAPEIVSKLDSMAKELNFEAVNKTEFKVKIQGKVDGRKGKLAVMAEVLEIAPELALVELSKCSGDTLEYAKFCEEEVRPALKDIVWIWQGDNSSSNSSQVGSTN